MSRKPTHGYFVKGQFVAYGSELDVELSQRDIPSKSDLKKVSEELQELGEGMLTLRPGLFAKLDLPENLRDAIIQAKTITNFEGKRRQMQYIGKLMRKVDPEPIRAVLLEQREGSAEESQSLHLAEYWRDKLIAEENALTDWMAAHPAQDAQHMRALIRQARKDAQAALKLPAGETPRHGKAYREIFQAVKSCLQEDAASAADAHADEFENDDE